MKLVYLNVTLELVYLTLIQSFHQFWIKVQVRTFRSLFICTAYRLPDVPVRCFDIDLTPSFIAASLHNKPITF